MPGSRSRRRRTVGGPVGSRSGRCSRTRRRGGFRAARRWRSTRRRRTRRRRTAYSRAVQRLIDQVNRGDEVRAGPVGQERLELSGRGRDDAMKPIQCRRRSGRGLGGRSSGPHAADDVLQLVETQPVEQRPLVWARGLVGPHQLVAKIVDRTPQRVALELVPVHLVRPLRCRQSTRAECRRNEPIPPVRVQQAVGPPPRAGRPARIGTTGPMSRRHFRNRRKTRALRRKSAATAAPTARCVIP